MKIITLLAYVGLSIIVCRKLRTAPEDICNDYLDNFGHYKLNTKNSSGKNKYDRRIVDICSTSANKKINECFKTVKGKVDGRSDGQNAEQIKTLIVEEMQNLDKTQKGEIHSCLRNAGALTSKTQIPDF